MAPCWGWGGVDAEVIPLNPPPSELDSIFDYFWDAVYDEAV